MENSTLRSTREPKMIHVATVAVAPLSAVPLSASAAKNTGTPRRGGAPRMDKDQARIAIVAAWPNWAQRNLNGRKAKDNDAHAFLRSVRLEHPDLFRFRSTLSSHEVAFFWLLDAGFVAY